MSIPSRFRVGDLVKFAAVTSPKGLKPRHSLEPPIVLGYVSVASEDGSVVVDYRSPVVPFEAILELRPDQVSHVLTLVRRMK